MDRLRELDQRYGNRLHTLLASTHNIEAAVLDADLVIGARLVAGRRGAQAGEPRASSRA